MSDYHLHLYPHRRGESTPPPPEEIPLSHIERYVTAAAERGVHELAFTEHLFRCVESAEALGPFWEQAADPVTRGHTEADVRADRTMSLERYVEAILGAKDAGLPVLLGLEVDFVPGTVESVLELIAPYPWDVLIGSVHWIEGWWFDRRHSIHEWERRGHRRVYEQYFALETALADSGTVDVLAHVDRIKYQGQRLAEPPLDLYEGLVKAARRADVAIELSSAGLRHPIAEAYPAPPLLEMCRVAGLDITFASDGHLPEQAGWGHDEIRRLARDAGYTHTARFRARKRDLVPIIPPRG
ncbi:MAG: PHP domain-containing protein [Acidimicrobiia bacterium]|nr:PHP domain-containing protein [Acidimicrobiia bacterium]